MNAPAKKFFFALLLVIGVTLFIFILQLRKAGSITVTQTQQQLVSNDSFAIPLGPEDPLFGNPGSALTVVEFADLHNARSRELHSLLIQFVDAHPQDVRLFWKNLPQKALLYGDNYLVHQAAICAGTSTGFWQFVGSVLTQKDIVKKDQLDSLLINTALATPEFNACLYSASTTQKLAADVQAATDLGITNAPAIFINNKRIDTTANIDWNQMLSSLIEKQP